MSKIIKVIVDIEQDKLGVNIRGNFNVTSMLFSDLQTTMDAEQMVNDVSKMFGATGRKIVTKFQEGSGSTGTSNS